MNLWRSTELLVSGFLIAVASAIFAVTQDYPNIDFGMGGSPSLYPRVLASLLLVLAALMLMQGLRKPTAIELTGSADLVRPLTALVVIFAAIAVTHYLGFRITAMLTAFFIMALLFDWREANLSAVGLMLTVAVVVGLLLPFVFEDLAGRRLPGGILLRGY